MAEVESYCNHVILKGKAPWLQTLTPAPPSTLEEARTSLHPQDLWTTNIIIHSDEGKDVALAIQERSAYAVSDGSYKQQWNTSAFLLESRDCKSGRVIGLNEIPGAPEDQSAYRSELAGISGIMAVVDCLCRLHYLTSGTIHCRLDGEQAMLNASSDQPLDPQQPSFDFLIDIKSKIKSSPFDWQFSWVEGHQEERHGKEDFWGQLNDVCNSMAKIYWNQTSLSRQPRPNQRFSRESWSATIQGKKLAKMPMKDLYDFTFGEEKSKTYWMTKHPTTPQLFARINWDACGKAMKTLLFGKKCWLVKHLSGWCATGRNMLRRKEWMHDKCPICLQPNETIDHIIHCPDIRARMHRAQAIDNLIITLKKIKTDPAIIDAIHRRLLHRQPNRRYSRSDQPSAVDKAYQDQDLISWDQFCHGRVSKKWEDVQELWLIPVSTKWKRSCALWLQRLISAIWEMSFQIWDHRNSVLHHPLHPWKQAIIQDREQWLREEFRNYIASQYLPSDRRLFLSSATHMLQHHSAAQQE
jgi:hypothetical protein